MGAELWQPVLFGALIGTVGTGLLMMVRGDFLGKRAAQEVGMRLADEDKRLSIQINESEGRVNERIDREMKVIRDDVKEIKETLVRIEGRMQ